MVGHIFCGQFVDSALTGVWSEGFAEVPKLCKLLSKTIRQIAVK